MWLDWIACRFWAFFGSYQVSIFNPLSLLSLVVLGSELFLSFSLTSRSDRDLLFRLASIGVSILLRHRFPVDDSWIWRVLSPGAWSFGLSFACAIYHRRNRKPEVYPRMAASLCLVQRSSVNHHVLLFTFGEGLFWSVYSLLLVWLGVVLVVGLVVSLVRALHYKKTQV